MKGKQFLRIPAFIAALSMLGLAVLSGCAPAVSPSAPVGETPADRVLHVMTHDSFAISESVLEDFQQENHVTVQILKSGDTGTALNKAILAKDKERFSRDNTQLLSNRHFLFEAVAARMQVLGAAAPEKLYSALSQKVAALCAAQDKEDNPPTTTLMKQFKASNKRAFDCAHKIDKLVSKAFPKKLVGDPSYDPFADGAFDVSPYFSDASVQSWIDGQRNKKTPFLNEIGGSLSNAVEATLAALLAVLR